MKVYLHIGDGRTGTTTLQSLLSRNKEEMRRQGVDYPDIGMIGTAHHKLSFCLMDKWPDYAIKYKTDRETVWSELAEYLDNNSDAYDSCLLSSEGFTSLNRDGVEFIADFFKNIDVTAIFVRRDPEDRRRSMREHMIRRGKFVPEPNGPATDSRAAVIRMWRELLKLECIPYGPGCSDQVLKTAGVSPDDFVQVKRLNSQPPDGTIELLNEINRIPLHEDNRLQLNSVIWNWARDRS